MSTSKHSICFQIDNLDTEPPTPLRQLSLQMIDSGDVCALVLLNLRSAFDTVDHETLMHVLQQRFGVKGPTLSRFGSYQCERTQAFYHNTQQSGPYRVDCSVPQWTVLRPKKFIAYTIELAVLIDSYQLGQHLYADDAQLMKRTRFHNVASTIQTLQLNPSKTEVIWFGTTHSLKNMESLDLSLRVGNNIIEPATVVRDLGVLLDSEQSLKKHINKVASIFNLHLRRLKPIRCILARQITIHRWLACTGCVSWSESSTRSTFKIMQRIAKEYLGPVVRVADLPVRQSVPSASTNRLVMPPFKLSTIGTRAFPVASPRVRNTYIY